MHGPPLKPVAHLFLLGEAARMLVHKSEMSHPGGKAKSASVTLTICIVCRNQRGVIKGNNGLARVSNTGL
jgi:sulfur relay (sulfurtransferase) complex TusBCD TusD component (DsrE family)